MFECVRACVRVSQTFPLSSREREKRALHSVYCGFSWRMAQSIRSNTTHPAARELGSDSCQRARYTRTSGSDPCATGVLFPVRSLPPPLLIVPRLRTLHELPKVGRPYKVTKNTFNTTFSKYIYVYRYAGTYYGAYIFCR